ncbi:hypothetical protein Taro_035058 [Colocasia esculenta]|uniref:Uncharacterized protein n=1 Tax=Colocasia esculenta TaxID=4460 RepID=A0A843VY10_COLES|nr:hypothetical protein [Colocasia esculenta]
MPHSEMRSSVGTARCRILQVTIEALGLNAWCQIFRRAGRHTPFGLITWKAELVEKLPLAFSVQTNLYGDHRSGKIVVEYGFFHWREK